eukprot:14389764-Alexandrium_andersonii.AAC.1
MSLPWGPEAASAAALALALALSRSGVGRGAPGGTPGKGGALPPPGVEAGSSGRGGGEAVCSVAMGNGKSSMAWLDCTISLAALESPSKVVPVSRE